MESAKETIVGKAMDSWWDSSEEAGPKSRVREDFQQELPSLDFLTIQDDGTLVNLGFINAACFHYVFYFVTTVKKSKGY